MKSVYADVGQLFAQTTRAEPRLAAAMMGRLIKGMGVDHVCWGTDAILTGSPQRQIEALRGPHQSRLWVHAEVGIAPGRFETRQTTNARTGTWRPARMSFAPF